MRKQLFATAAGFAVAAAFGVGAAAQTAPPATPPQTAPPAQASPDRAEAQQVTLVGCVQREADYRQANNLGKGGAVGTGAGVSNEFVLINATAAAAAAPGATGTATGTPTGTSGATAAGQAFEVTGENESKLGQYVGQRVEITGTLKKAEVGPAGATGGATAGKPPTGVDVTSADLRLREVEIVSVKTTTGTCPTK